MFFSKNGKIFATKLFTFRFLCDIIYLAYKGEVFLEKCQKETKKISIIFITTDIAQGIPLFPNPIYKLCITLSLFI